MLDPCGLTMTRSVLNRPSARIWSSSPRICCCAAANIPNLSDIGPAEDDLAAQPAAHGGECLLVVAGVEPVRDHRRDVHARLDQHRHLVPGLEHLAAVDPLDG